MLLLLKFFAMRWLITARACCLRWLALREERDMICAALLCCLRYAMPLRRHCCCLPPLIAAYSCHAELLLRRHD